MNGMLCTISIFIIGTKLILSENSENVGSTGFPENQVQMFDGQDKPKQERMLALANEDAEAAGIRNIGIMRSTRSPFGQLRNMGFFRPSRSSHEIRYGTRLFYLRGFGVLRAKNIGRMWPKDNILTAIQKEKIPLKI